MFLRFPANESNPTFESQCANNVLVYLFNSAVRRGQVVARLAPSLFQTQVDQAQATVARLQADVERARVGVTDTQLKLRRAQELFAMQLLPKSELDTVTP